ncbi:hypothetical protein ACHAXT_007681 [Thalassiosira profunda]
MLARSLRRGGSGWRACRHAASSAARRWGADGAPSAAGGKRTLAEAARCSSALANSPWAASHNTEGCGPLVPLTQGFNGCGRHASHLYHVHQPIYPLHNSAPSSVQLRSYHSVVPQSPLAIANRMSGEMIGAPNSLEINGGASHSLEQTLQRAILRAWLSTHPSPNFDTDGDGDEKSKEGETTKPESEAKKVAKTVSAAEDKLNGKAKAAEHLLGKETKKFQGESAAGKAANAEKKKAAVAPVHHATATDAFVALVASLPHKATELIVAGAKALASLLAKTPGVLWYYLRHPSEFKDKLAELKEAAKKEAHHYWMGSKLLAADLRTARQMLGRALQGTPLTRRERKQLLRTVSDVFRLVPMSIFVLIPFMEFALPFALKIFPNMLPSTFQDSLKAEENMKRELKMRLTMAEFFQESLQDLAQEQKKRAARKLKAKGEEEKEEGGANCDQVVKLEKKEETAKSFLKFLEKARKGEILPAEEIIQYAAYFSDELTLDNMPRMQLVNFCRYMSIPPYGSDNILRFQLRHRMRLLQEDDQRILFEGIDSLTKMELREACQERGMRSTGLSKEGYKRDLQNWLDLSVNRNVPISLVIMSRIFFLQEEDKAEKVSAYAADEETKKSVAGLADAISGLDKDIVNEVVLSVASSEEKSSDPDLVKMKLEVLEHQNEMIEEEKKERDEAAAKKAAKEQEKAKALAAEADEEAAAAAEAKEEMASPAPEGPSQAEVEMTTSEPVKVKGEAPAAVGGTKEAVFPPDTTEYRVAIDEEEEGEDDDEEEKGLSTEEIDAISELVSPNAVSKEREELERIKAAMIEDEEDEEAEDELGETLNAEGEEQPTKAHAEPPGPDDAPDGPQSIDEADAKVAEAIEKMEADVIAEAAHQTKISLDSEKVETTTSSTEETAEEDEPSGSGDERLDKAVDRLKYRVESMVGKLEEQLTDVEAKIGNKLHLLDKDLDETISTEEMSVVLQQVLKRKLSAEEAEVIAADMDANKDGFLTVAELSRWVENNKIIKLLEEGREGEIDKMIERRKEKLIEEMHDRAETGDEADEVSSKESKS